MKHITTDKEFAYMWKPIQCIKNDPLTQMDIQGECFLLLILTEGKAIFSTADEKITATAPCFVCFNKLDTPAILQQDGMKNYAIYFDPTFLNVNMTFELQEQRDGYWSCRGRTFFIEIIILLERISRSFYEADAHESDILPAHDMALLEKAEQFIEASYNKNITLEDIVSFSGSNHTTLTELFKKKHGTTPIKYVITYRIEIAKKQIAFTSVPLKDVATQCGFKTVQHFARVFKECVGETPASYRHRTVVQRIRDLQ